MVLRRARALAHILEQMTVYIRPDEMIVGNYASNTDSVPFYPELAWKWIKRETAPGQVYECMLSDEGRSELEEICDYWGNHSIHHRMKNYLPEALGEVFWVFNWEASTPNYDKILEVGLREILQEVTDRKASLEEEYLAETMNGEEYLRKRDVLDAMVIALEAVMAWSKRYAALASDLAQKETDPTRKRELEAIARRCEWVPENPARTFQEALQCYWLVHLIINFIDLPQVGSGIRLDQTLHPFYERDVRKGRITRDEAQECIEFLFVKFQETGFLHAPIWSGFGGGALGFQTVTIGGVDAQGNDVTNELSYIVLDATKSVRAIVPPLALRWHDGIPAKLVEKAIEVMASGMPQPAIFNDKVNIVRDWWTWDAPSEDARSYSINNCMVPTIPGKNLNHISAWASGVPLPLCLTTALGIPHLLYKKAGETVIDPERISSVKELMDAVVENYAWTIHRLVLVGTCRMPSTGSTRPGPSCRRSSTTASRGHRTPGSGTTSPTTEM